MTIRLFAGGAVVALALSACANANSAAVPGYRTAIGPATPAATTGPSFGGGSAASAQRSTMTISIALPPKKAASGIQRAPRTVSPGIAYLDIVLQSLNGEAQPVTGPYTVLVPASQLTNCGARAGSSHTSARHVSAVLATDLTTQQPLTIGYDSTQPDATAAAQEIDFDPNACKNVTVGPNDPSGVTDGSTLQFCEPQESGVRVVVQ